MNQIASHPEEFQELADLVRASFPDLRCLRCGHGEFYSGLNNYTLAHREPGTSALVSSIGDTHQILTLACTRCGHLEHHMLEVLEKAQKPISARIER